MSAGPLRKQTGTLSTLINTAAVGVDSTADFALAWGSTLCRRTRSAEAIRVETAADLALDYGPLRRRALDAVAMRVEPAADFAFLGSLPTRAGDTEAARIEAATDLGPKLGEEAQSLIKDAVDPRNLTVRRG